MQTNYLSKALPLLVVLYFLGALTANAQNGFFEPVSTAQMRLDASVTRNIKKISLYRLKEKDLRTYLAKAPLEFKQQGPAIPLQIPLPNGTTETFDMVESPVLAPAVAANHPDIKTYTGTGKINKNATIRLSFTALGFNAIIVGLNGDAAYYEKITSSASNQLYRVYLVSDVQKPTRTRRFGQTPGCGVVDSPGLPKLADNTGNGSRKSAVTATSGDVLRTFRLAVAADGEFTNQPVYGGNVNLAFAGLVDYVNRANAIFRTELSVQLNLVTDVTLVYSNTATDPYTDPDQGASIVQNQANLDNVIGNANYDIGHLLGSPSGGGIAAFRSTCDNAQKGQGTSGLGGGPAAYDDQIFSHEMGHQFGMSHSYNSNLGACVTREATTTVEPGAGITIMSYAYICTTMDGLNTDDYEQPANFVLHYHGVNYDQAQAYISTLSCFTATATGNAIPTVTSMPTNKVIPKSTPFSLTGSGADANAGNVLTYSWEGTDNAPLTPDAATLDNTALPPFFRSYEPVPSGTRTFPRLSAILDGSNQAKGDKLPSVEFTTKHRMTVRDGVGGVAFGETTVTIAGNSGPFLETTNLDGSYSGGSAKTITWSVNNTTAPPVSCASVDILLSTDGGLTFPTVLVANTPNDGSESITLPALITTTARIKIASSNNIFFDISNANFTIRAVPVIGLTATDSVATEGTGGASGGRLAAGSTTPSRIVRRSRNARQAADEPHADPAIFHFARDNADEQLDFDYEITGSASDDGFLVFDSRETFAVGEFEFDLYVYPGDDLLTEGDETLTFTILDDVHYDVDPTDSSASITILDANTAPAPFSITAVTTLACTPAGDRTSLRFNPQYAGLTGEPVTFQVVNELLPTTASGPYTLQLYADNPVISLRATQSGTSGETSFSYNWLEACNGMVPGNTPPTVANLIPTQSATVGQFFNYGIPANTFTDAQTPASLVLSVSGLPPGLSFTAPATISGTPSTTVGSPYTVSVTATDPGSLSVSTSLVISVSPVSPTPTGPFAITGVTTVNCTPAGNRINLSFNPQYAGLNGQAVTFSVVNELSPTTQAGPYSLALYTDNPIITLRASQLGTVGESSFSYNWLAACSGGGAFGITAVTMVSCQTLSAGERQLSITPRYSGLNGQTITFQVLNELSPTTAPGPYTLRLYTDNPVITLKASQQGTAGEVSFPYNWIGACHSGSSARVASEPVVPLLVRVLGNPAEHGQVSVEVRGAAGQPLRMNLTNMGGQTVGSYQIERAGSIEQHTFEIGRQPVGQLLLRTTIPGQSQTVKIIKPD